MAKRYSKAAHAKRHKQTSHKIKNVIILIFCGAAIWFGCSLWYAARTLQTAHPAESIAGEEFRPQVGDPPYRVVIDAGHGGKDPGARGSSINEKAINLAVALKLGSLISEKHNDVKVIYTRKTDVFIELDERANIANRNKADLFISIHTNAVKRGSAVSGTETYTSGLARTDENLEVAMRENSAILLEDNYLQKYEGFDPTSSESYIIFEFMQNKHMEQSISLASEVQKCFTSAKRNNRGVRYRKVI